MPKTRNDARKRAHSDDMAGNSADAVKLEAISSGQAPAHTFERGGRKRKCEAEAVEVDKKQAASLVSEEKSWWDSLRKPGIILEPVLPTRNHAQYEYLTTVGKIRTRNTQDDQLRWQDAMAFLPTHLWDGGMEILGMSYSRAGAGIPPRTQAELRAIQGEDHDEQDEMPYYQMHMEPMTLARLEVCVKKMDLSNVYIHVGEDNGAPLLYIALSDDMHVLDYKCDRIPGRSMCKEEDRVWLLNHYDSYQERAGRREDLIEKLEADCPVPAVCWLHRSEQGFPLIQREKQAVTEATFVTTNPELWGFQDWRSQLGQLLTHACPTHLLDAPLALIPATIPPHLLAGLLPSSAEDQLSIVRTRVTYTQQQLEATAQLLHDLYRAERVLISQCEVEKRAAAAAAGPGAQPAAGQPVEEQQATQALQGIFRARLGAQLLQPDAAGEVGHYVLRWKGPARPTWPAAHHPGSSKGLGAAQAAQQQRQGQQQNDAQQPAAGPSQAAAAPVAAAAAPAVAPAPAAAAAAPAGSQGSTQVNTKELASVVRWGQQRLLCWLQRNEEQAAGDLKRRCALSNVLAELSGPCRSLLAEGGASAEQLTLAASVLARSDLPCNMLLHLADGMRAAADLFDHVQLDQQYVRRAAGTLIEALRKVHVSLQQLPQQQRQ